MMFSVQVRKLVSVTVLLTGIQVTADTMRMQECGASHVSPVILTEYSVISCIGVGAARTSMAMALPLFVNPVEYS